MTAVSNDVETLERENQRLRKQLAMIRGEVEPSKADDRFKQLIEIMPAGVVVIDGQGVIEQCNPAAQELLAEQLLGSLWRDVARRCFMPREDDGYEISLQDGRRISIQTRALSDFRGQLVLLNDVTQTREIQAQQAQSIRLAEMGKMTASLAHQIRTPLSAAVLYTDNLITGNLCNERGVAFAAKVKGRLKNIERQISDMLMFSREEIA
ncbi:MAG: histidine kinase dimerization/phospho-acceptor domain-containing protein, partial [Pseudomonadales bacterium]